jgi:hypothetical protein
MEGLMLIAAACGMTTLCLLCFWLMGYVAGRFEWIRKTADEAEGVDDFVQYGPVAAYLMAFTQRKQAARWLRWSLLPLALSVMVVLVVGSGPT